MFRYKRQKIKNTCLIISMLKSGSHLPKKVVLFASMKALSNDEKCFSFPLESFFSLSRYLNFCID